MLPWKLQKRQILTVYQNLLSVYFSLAKFQLVSCNLFLAMIWQMKYTFKLPKLCSATLRSLLLQTRLRERDGADKESLQDSDSDEDEYSRTESDDNDKNDNDSINSGGEDVILAFIDDEEEVERPATTRSGRSINRRSEIDFPFFSFSIFFYV